MSYVAVDKVDDSAEKIKELGGNVCVPPTDIPNVGRFCVVNDPTGATFSLIALKPWNPA
jgi:predicted enzyme related to lactoylglutathione lyase